MGIRNYYPSEALHVGGNILASGSITGSTKSFDITHEGREGYRLRHWCLEGDVPGGSLLYKRSVIADKAGVADLIMPSWFGAEPAANAWAKSSTWQDSVSCTSSCLGARGYANPH